MEVSGDELTLFFGSVMQHLNEVQRRVVAGSMARAIGHGGKSRVAEVSGMSRYTVVKAVTEDEAGIEPSGPDPCCRCWAETGSTIRVVHYPPGTSKWNKIEQRLFSFISMNWRGRPLTDIRTIVELISATSTKTGLTVQAVYDPGWYPNGQKIGDPELAGLPLATSGMARRLELNTQPHLTAQTISRWALRRP